MENTPHHPFTIIIPTYQEAANIPELVKRIANVDFDKRSFEVLLVDDDSQDGSREMICHLSREYPWLKMIVRDKQRDLSQSIIQGFKEARYPILVTMDADLSHPPEKIAMMLTLLDQPDVDMVIGSRYIKGGSVDTNWPFIRKLTSRTAAWIARIFLLSPVKDPLSGFLAMKKSTFIAGDTLKPIGWKIGLELMVKCRCKNIQEIPIHFSERCRGKSKLNMRISVAYLRHVLKLWRYKILL